MTTADDKLIAQYLLGELSEEERDRFEEQFFSDDLFFQKVEAARDQLIEDYLRGGLSGRDRERFDAYFLSSPSRREKVETMRALIQEASRTEDLGANIVHAQALQYGTHGTAGNNARSFRRWF